MKRFLLALGFLVLAALPANAATCFWVGGAGTWDNATDAAHWASGTGGTPSTCAATGGVPKNAGDIATFDGLSGGGTVTNNVALSIAQITCGAFTGTLDWATNNRNVSLTSTFNCSGSGTRTLNLGNGTWTITSASATPWTIATTTNLTFNKNSSVIAVTCSAATCTFNGGSLSYNTVTLAGSGGQRVATIGGGNTFATLNVTAPLTVNLTNGTTTTITNPFTWTGTTASPIGLVSNNIPTAATISVASGSPTISGGAIASVTFSGGATFTATGSLDLGGNTGITITAPASGSSVGIIGGG